jgi:phospholipid/cholesterol/gamma-HCH transport system substrate-binding protein
MHDRAYALFSLAFLVLLGLGVAAAAVWLIDPGTERRPYDLVTEASISGLDDSSRLYYRGVAAGRVDSVGITADGRVRVRIRVDPGIPVTGGTYATLAPQGLTGLSHLALDDDGSDPEPLATSTEDPARIPLRRGLLDRVTETGEEAFAELQELINRMNRLLADEHIDNLAGTMANLEAASGATIRLQDRAAEMLATVPPLIADARQTLAHMDATLGRVDDAADEMAAVMPRLQTLSEEFAELARTANRVGGRIDSELMPRVDQALEQLTRTAEDLSRTARQFERQPEGLLRGRTPGRPGPGEPGYQPRGGN